MLPGIELSRLSHGSHCVSDRNSAALLGHREDSILPSWISWSHRNGICAGCLRMGMSARLDSGSAVQNQNQEDGYPHLPQTREVRVAGRSRADSAIFHRSALVFKNLSVGTLSAGIPWIIWNPINPTFAAPVIELRMVGWMHIMKISILVFFLVLFVLTSRPFCRTLCPLGAFYSLFNRVSYVRMDVEGSCVDCDLCVQVCPVQIRISDDPNSPDCIRCLECTVCENVHVRWGIKHEPSVNSASAAYTKS